MKTLRLFLALFLPAFVFGASTPINNALLSGSGNQVVTGATLTIPSGATLTASPGSILNGFSGSGTVNGGTAGQLSYYATTGTAVSPVTFASADAGGNGLFITSTNTARTYLGLYNTSTNGKSWELLSQGQAGTQPGAFSISNTTIGQALRISAAGALTLPTYTTAGVLINDTSGNVASSVLLPAAQFPALTGDVTTSAGAVATTLATVNSNVGPFTNASITVDAKGRITAASTGSGGSSPLTTKGDTFGFSTVNARVPVGVDGTVYMADSTQATGTKWATVSGTGDVVGPASSTDNAITRFDSTTGKLVQNSTAILDDSGNIQANGFYVGIAPSALAQVYLLGTQTASGGVGASIINNTSLTAAANSDSLFGVSQGVMTIAKGSFTGLTYYNEGLFNPSVTGGGTIDNQYQLYIATPTRGTNNYSIYSAGGINQLVGGVTLGLAGTTVGTAKFTNATSGTITLQAVMGALGTPTLSLPATTGTLLNSTGSFTTGNLVATDSSGRAVDSGSIPVVGVTSSSGAADSGKAPLLNGSGVLDTSFYTAGSAADRLSVLTGAEISITTTATATIGRMHVCSGTSADYTVTLPAVSGNTGKFIGFRMAGGLTKLVTIDGNSTETIDGSLTRIMHNYETCELFCDGVTWTKIAGKSIPMTARISLSGSTPAQTIANTTGTTVAYNNTVSDPYGMVSGSTLVARRPGRFDFYATVSWDANTPWTATRVISNVKAAGVGINQTEQAMSLGTYGSFGSACSAILALSDAVLVEIYQNSGLSQGLFGSNNNYLEAVERLTW